MERIKRAAAACLLLVVACVLLLMAGLVLASPVCNVAKENWISEPDLKQALKRQGYLVKTVRIDNGCYAIYGLDPWGRRILKYFDPATGKQVSEPSRSAEIPT